jgi:DNA-binding ferritin-like protein
MLIEHLRSAMALADELGDTTTVYLIERAFDEATSRRVKTVDPNQTRRKSRG